MERKKNSRFRLSILFNNLFLLRIALKAAPLTVIYKLIEGIFFGAVIFVEHTYQLVYIIDCIQYGKPFFAVAAMIIAVFTLVCFKVMIQKLTLHLLMPNGMEKIYKAFREKLYVKAKEMDLACYDDPEFYNDYVFVIENAPSQISGVINTISELIGNIFMLFILGGFVLFYDSVSVVFVATSFIASFMLRFSLTKASFLLEKELTPLRRKIDYIKRVFYLPDFAKEIRLSNIKDRLQEEYIDTEKQIFAKLKQRTHKIAILDFLQDYLSKSFIFDLVYLLYLMFLAIVKKTLSLGGVYGLYNSVQQTKQNIASYSQKFSNLKSYSLYVEKVKAFLAHGQTVIGGAESIPTDKETSAIEFKNVSFTYPNSTEPSLYNVSFTIQPGEKIAIVGYNGAGKTTLVKLLLRLYDPLDGKVKYDGKDICNFKLKEYRNLFVTLFQDYQIYAATVAQNIMAEDSNPDEAHLNEVLKSIGLTKRVMQMPEGINTQLTREFEEGENLSGGEKQKIALGRCLYKDSRIIVLDEPSSALDPIAEYELNNTILQLGHDKTVVFISHRLSTTKIADRILMLEKGKLIESGSHEELLSINGKYAKMFRLQAEKYR